MAFEYCDYERNETYVNLRHVIKAVQPKDAEYFDLTLVDGSVVSVSEDVINSRDPKIIPASGQTAVLACQTESKGKHEPVLVPIVAWSVGEYSAKPILPCELGMSAFGVLNHDGRVIQNDYFHNSIEDFINDVDERQRKSRELLNRINTAKQGESHE